MLAAVIVLSVAVAVLIIFVQTAWSKIDRMQKKLNDLLNYDPYTGDSISEYKRLCSRKPYDTKPEFIKGIDAMVEELNRSWRNRVNYGGRYDGVTQDAVEAFDKLDKRVDNIEYTICRFGSRIDELEARVKAINSDKKLDDEFETGILNSHFEDSEDEDAGE